MFGWFKRKPAASAVAPAPVPDEAPAPEPAPAPAPAAKATAPAYPGQSFVADEPIAGAAQDRFRRAPFATRVADTIAKRGEASSLVIGIFGPWGDGKTSVLQMMEERLNRYEDVIVVRFNPWHFPSEEQLLRGFFSTLADALGKKLPNFKERAGELLKNYGSLLSVASLTFGGMVQFKPGDAARGVGEAMSNVSLDELKDRIERLLDESGKRMVIMVDDIDRLDRAETHSIFKLVKLSASFRHTAYVLAFDDEVVAAALGERYGAGGHQAGRAFLEKIVQVPLHLPPADEISLRMIAFDGVEAALKQAEIDLPQPAIDAFVRRFVDGLEPKLATPRMAKIYTNALMFALPLLKGEANIVDLMLMEGIRILYPSLYVAIRDNPDVFLKSDRENRMNGLANERETRGAASADVVAVRLRRPSCNKMWDVAQQSSPSKAATCQLGTGCAIACRRRIHVRIADAGVRSLSPRPVSDFAAIPGSSCLREARLSQTSPTVQKASRRAGHEVSVSPTLLAMNNCCSMPIESETRQ